MPAPRDTSHVVLPAGIGELTELLANETIKTILSLGYRIEKR
jgi:hypothetical protein